MAEMDDEDLQQLYTWIDEIPLSRPKKNIARDFSDGVLIAEVAKHFIPKLVDLHNYTPANSTTQKLSNWSTLNRKIFARLSFNVPDNVVRGAVNAKPGVIEFVLNNLRVKIQQYLSRRPDKGLPITRENGLPDGLHSQESDAMYSDASDMLNSAAFGHAPSMVSRHMDLAGMTRVPPNGVPVGYHLTPQNSSHLSVMGSVPRRSTVPGADAPQVSKGDVLRVQSISNRFPHLDPRIAAEEKEQQLLEAQETIQILQVKVRRLEHLLRLKDMRIEELAKRLQLATSHPPP